MERKGGVVDAFRLPEEMWVRLEVLLPKRRRRKRRNGGRPPLDPRCVADAIFYVLRTGIQWKALPRELGSGSSVHRYFQQWERAGVFEQLWAIGLLEYDDRKGIQWKWQSMDGAMGKAPLGGEKNRAQSHRPGERRDQAFRARRRRRGADRPGD